MKAYFVPCHMCGSYSAEVLTPAFLADGSLCDFQKIVICTKCGLVYKNPVIPDLNKLVYCKHSWGDGAIFNKRISELVLYLSDFVKKGSPEKILEIGPGPGWLAMALQDLLPATKFILLEASDEVAKVAKYNVPTATVIPASIDEAYIDNNIFDLAIVCGVDYLFPNFHNAIISIFNKIKTDGYLYIERNVFVESEAYAWSPITSYADLFGKNALMTTWFSVDQYKQFLKQFFDIISEKSFLHDETDGYKCIIHGFICKKKAKYSEYYDGDESWYEQNMTSLTRLSKVNSTLETKAQAPHQGRISKIISFIVNK